MKIMLDAGHGFSTPGKRSPDGLKEYEFNRKVAHYAKELLETYQDVIVFFAHSDDRDVPLNERTDAANKLNVQAYVSIHANAYGNTWNDARGIETYVYKTNPKEACELAQKIQTNLVSFTGLRNRGVKTADFHVLRETKMTAVLTECGFMTNRDESQFMHTENFQRKCAEAIVNGLATQYHLVRKQADSSPPSVPAPSKIYRVQVGAFKDSRNAEALIQRLQAAGFDAILYSESQK